MPADATQAQIGNAPGNFIPEAPSSAAVALPDWRSQRAGWLSTLRWRYISTERPVRLDELLFSDRHIQRRGKLVRRRPRRL
jgi:hypothetical protein